MRLGWPGTTARRRLRELEPYAELAREAQGQVGSEELTAANRQAILEQIAKNERERLVVAALGQLPIDRQYDALARTFSDIQLQGAAAKMRAEAKARLDFQDRIAALRQYGQTHQSIKLSDVPPHAAMAVDLYSVVDFADIDGAPRTLVKKYQPVRKLMTSSQDPPGRFVVVQDLLLDGDQRAHPYFKPHDAIGLGSLITDVPGTSGSLSDEIYLGSSLDYTHGAAQGNIHNSDYFRDVVDLVIGRVSIHDQVVLGY